MPGSYLPNTDSTLLDWGRNFSTLINATPATYGLSAGQATAFATLYTAYETAYNTAVTPETRTKGAIAAKNTAKTNLKVDARNLVSIIQGIATVSDQQKIDLGITVRDSEPTPIPPPDVAPEIDFIATGSRTIRVRLHNERALRLRKPAGVKGATVFYHVGAAAPAELSAWTFHESTTKPTLDVNLPSSVAAGSQVWFTAFWFNPRSQSGPAATPVSTFMQFGGLSMAA